jgi:hypothetical protein
MKRVSQKVKGIKCYRVFFTDVKAEVRERGSIGVKESLPGVYASRNYRLCLSFQDQIFGGPVVLLRVSSVVVLLRPKLVSLGLFLFLKLVNRLATSTSL